MSRGERPCAPGFGALFAFDVAKALAEVPPLDEAELLLPSLRAAKPPSYCPCCAFPVSSPSRDEEGAWTWACFGGCNP